MNPVIAQGASTELGGWLNRFIIQRHYIIFRHQLGYNVSSMSPQIVFFLEILARSGGGGSSGGSGGGGGEAIALLGYFPSYYLGKLIKKLLPRDIELVVSIATASLVTVVLLTIGAVISGASFLFMALVVAGVWAGWYAAFFSLWDKLKKRAEKTKVVIDTAAQLDSTWNIDGLKDHARRTFLTYQQDWASFNLQNITTYTTQRYAKHAGLMLRTLKEMHRTNTMADVEILQLEITEARDSQDNADDYFRVAFEAKAKDTLIDTQTGATLFSDTSTFTEYWTFVRNNNTWLLDRIEQATASVLSSDATIEAFATKNAMYYSPDMGWLFLPNRGVLFSGGKFGTSDINNHVVGLYNQNLVQLYTYQPNRLKSNSSRSNTYNVVVAQINLPKSYEGILIRRKTGFFNSWRLPTAPRNYTEYRLEWPDFHERYTVHATNQDRLATFELLNPGFMAYLYDTDSGVSIEVADNVVYLYKPLAAGNRPAAQQQYGVFMEILNRAFKELRL